MDSVARERAASVASVEEFNRSGRKVGYFCRIAPVGYIIVSLRRQLAPVKAYSDKTALDPASEEGMADLLKGKMARLLDGIEKQAGPTATAPADETPALVEIDYTGVWRQLLSGPLRRESTALDQQQSLSRIISGTAMMRRIAPALITAPLSGSTGSSSR